MQSSIFSFASFSTVSCQAASPSSLRRFIIEEHAHKATLACTSMTTSAPMLILQHAGLLQRLPPRERQAFNTARAARYSVHRHDGIKLRKPLQLCDVAAHKSDLEAAASGKGSYAGAASLEHLGTLRMNPEPCELRTPAKSSSCSLSCVKYSATVPPCGRTLQASSLSHTRLTVEILSSLCCLPLMASSTSAVLSTGEPSATAWQNCKAEIRSNAPDWSSSRPDPDSSRPQCLVIVSCHVQGYSYSWKLEFERLQHL